MDELFKGYIPYEIKKTSHINPDNPLFHSFDLNVVILTKYGRYVFLRHGNEERCSSFFATLATIVNKLELSFGQQDKPASLKKVKQGRLQFYVIKRCNFMYIFWCKADFADLRLFSMAELLHYQLMSSLTSKVNAIIDSNQTYDPTVNFGKGTAIQTLLQYSIQNGLHSLPTLFNAAPVLLLKNQARSAINNILNVREYKTDGLQVSILMSMNAIVGINKKKNLDIETKDLFLFFVLLQAQSTLSKSENWFPICLPGVEPQSMIFCYLNFMDKELIHVMISDESDIFPKMSEINKQVRQKLEAADLIARINAANNRNLIDDPSLEISPLLRHFLIRNQACEQMVMSKGQYFGDNMQFDPEYTEYHNIYAELYEHLLTVKHYRKEKLHVQTMRGYVGGYYEEGPMCVFFILSRLADFEEAKNVINGILKLMKEEEVSLFIGKY